MAQFALSGTAIECKIKFEPDISLCEYDENQMSQVIDNIILNAEESMPNGGTLSIYAQNTYITQGERSDLDEGAFVCISIEDTGDGIPNELLSRIFDPFFSTKKNGSGLGLSTAYSIIRKHGGVIDAFSEPGRGSSFKIYLPATQKVDSEPPLEKGEVTKFKGVGNVLVMDDEDFFREILSEIMGGLGYSVVCASNGSQALELLRTQIQAGKHFAAIVLDLTIPDGAGGKDIINEVRKLDSTVVVIASSGYTDDPVMTHPQQFGFSGSIRKPYAKNELVSLLAGFQQ